MILVRHGLLSCCKAIAIEGPVQVKDHVQAVVDETLDITSDS